jgi:hypothetical protein
VEEVLMDRTTVGLFVGLILGLALVIEGFGAMLIVAFFGALGFLAARAINGELDLSDYIGDPSARRASRR